MNRLLQNGRLSLIPDDILDYESYCDWLNTIKDTDEFVKINKVGHLKFIIQDFRKTNDIETVADRLYDHGNKAASAFLMKSMGLDPWHDECCGNNCNHWRPIK